MKNYVFRLLKAHEIEARPSRINKDNSVNLLLYKTSRVDMQLLDETYGNCGWQVEHKIVDGELWTTLLVRDPETGEVIKKEDVGEWSDNTLRKLKDKENPVPVDELYLVPNASKSRFSDGLKRCGTLMGIGRELYSAPDIYIPANKVTVKYGQCYTKFEVEEIEYDEYKQIVYLKIVDEKTGEPLFVWRRRNSKKITKEAPSVKPQAAPKAESKETPVQTTPKESPNNEATQEAPKTKRLKIASKEQVDKLLNLISESGIGRDYILNLYKKKFGIYTYYKLPEIHVQKMIEDFDGTVLAPFRRECEKEMRQFMAENNLTFDDLQKVAGSTDWMRIAACRKKIEIELLDKDDELPFC